MNKLDFFKAVLMTNKDFDIPTINKYIEYFNTQINWDIDLSNFFLKEQHEIAELFDQFEFSDGILEYQSEYYGNTPYQIKCEYDENGTIKESIIKTEEEKIIFIVKDLEVIPINNNARIPFYRGIAICKNKYETPMCSHTQTQWYNNQPNGGSIIPKYTNYYMMKSMD